MTIANLARSRIVRLAALLTAALALVGCDTYPVNYKYRLTLEVEADGKVHTGSSVVHVWVRENAEFWGGMGGVHLGALGEATVVDLGKGRLLIALLTEREYKTNIWMPDHRKPPASRDLDPWELPLLVTFTDASDPKTVREVDPTNLASTLGPGVQLRRAHVEAAEERPNGSILKHLPWLTTIGGRMLDGRKYSTRDAENRLANTLGSYNFI